MKALRTLTLIRALSSKPGETHFNSALLRCFYSAQPQRDESPVTAITDEYDDASSVFDSSHYDLDLNLNRGNSSDDSGSERKSTWDDKYRDTVRSKVFGEDVKHLRMLKKEEDKKKRAAILAKSLLEAALEQPDEEEEEGDPREVKEEDQKSLSVGIIGAPNAGKSALTNCMVCFFFLSESEFGTYSMKNMGTLIRFDNLLMKLLLFLISALFLLFFLRSHLCAQFVDFLG